MIHDLLLWLHFVALAVGGAGTFGGVVVGVVLARQGEAARAALAPVARGLGRLGHGGLALLILTGIGLVDTGPGWTGVGPAFGVKIALVAVLVVSVAVATRSVRRGFAGDGAAGRLARLLGRVNGALVTLIVLAAVVEFG